MITLIELGIEGRMKPEKIFSVKERKEIQNKIFQAIEAEMKTLSPEMQHILCDDLVTAFQNRLTILTRANQDTPEQWKETVLADTEQTYIRHV